MKGIFIEHSPTVAYYVQSSKDCDNLLKYTSSVYDIISISIKSLNVGCGAIRPLFVASFKSDLDLQKSLLSNLGS